MMTPEEKMDAVQDSITGLAFSMQKVELRLDSFEKTLTKREESMESIYDFMQKTDQRLTKIEAYSSAGNQFWGKISPFLVAFLGIAAVWVGEVVWHIAQGG